MSWRASWQPEVGEIAATGASWISIALASLGAQRLAVLHSCSCVGNSLCEKVKEPFAVVQVCTPIAAATGAAVAEAKASAAASVAGATDGGAGRHDGAWNDGKDVFGDLSDVQ